jgi:pimeloyl-ACP methyl ester carboxylesterase
VAESTPLSVNRDGLKLIGEQWLGVGPSVAFLHAGVTDRRSWNQVVAQLTQSASPVTYDRRGFGQTSVSPAPFSHVDDLLALLGATADEPAWLVGSSMGGGLALDAALMAPEMVAGLVLIAPAVSGSTEFELDPDTARIDRLLDQAIENEDLDNVNRLETWLWLDGPGQPEGRVPDPVRSLALEMNQVILRNDVPEEAGSSGMDAWSRIEDVRVPAIVACGDLDVPFLKKRSREIAERLPFGQFVDLTGVAHLPQMEKPDVVAMLVQHALA